MLDVWYHVLSLVDTIGELLTLRSVCADANEAFMQHVLHASVHCVRPRATLIPLLCMACGAKERHCIGYRHDEFPRRVLLFCDRADCFLAALGRFAFDARHERLHPFVDAPADMRVWVPRSSGGWSPGRVRDNTPIYEGNMVAVDFASDVVLGTRPSTSPALPDALDLCKKVPAAQLGVRLAPTRTFARLFAREWPELCID